MNPRAEAIVAEVMAYCQISQREAQELAGLIMARLDAINSTDLLQRLRVHAVGHELTYGHTGICGEAGAEIARLRAALEGILALIAFYDEDGLSEHAECVMAARAALDEGLTLSPQKTAENEAETRERNSPLLEGGGA